MSIRSPTMAELTCQELVELVTEYLEGKLAPEQRARFEAHLKTCGNCTEYVREIRDTLRLLGRLKEENLQPHVKAELLDVFKTWKQTN